MKRESNPAQGLNAAVAAVLNGERVAAGMTFEQLADVSGISKQQLLRLLSTTKRHITLEAEKFNTTTPQVIAAAQERMSRADPEVYDAIRRNQRLGNQLSQKGAAGTDQSRGRARRPS